MALRRKDLTGFSAFCRGLKTGPTTAMAYDDLDLAAPCIHPLERRTPAAAVDGQIHANIAYLQSTDLEPVDALRQRHPVEDDTASPTVHTEPQGSLEQQDQRRLYGSPRTGYPLGVPRKVTNTADHLMAFDGNPSAIANLMH